MIISRIIGGLGNQLFQYAAGKSLALKHNTSLVLDAGTYDVYKLRNFDLHAFNTMIEFAKDVDIEKISSRSFIDKIKDRALPLSMRKLYKEPYFHFDKKIFSAPDNIYLKGYWQSEKYFIGYKDIIKKEFSLKAEFIEKVKALGDELKSKNSVSVHIRRGDYISQQINEMHNILTEGYYKEAISTVQKNIPDAKLFFFSDDINWAKENLHLPSATYVSGEISNTHLEDFYLMSQCRHNIIANSSFSWWGAWLNNNPDKIVIAPKKWFNKGPKDTQDLIPESWITI
jgi:hypothetical protein